MRTHRPADPGTGRLAPLRLVVGHAEAGHGERQVGQRHGDGRDAAAVDAPGRGREVEAGHGLEQAQNPLLRDANAQVVQDVIRFNTSAGTTLDDAADAFAEDEGGAPPRSRAAFAMRGSSGTRSAPSATAPGSSGATTAPSRASRSIAIDRFVIVSSVVESITASDCSFTTPDFRLSASAVT